MSEVITSIVKSPFRDPFINLALEELLLNAVEPNEVLLLLWQNTDSVILGRNQNPWQECRMSQLNQFEGILARRLSGGGAVYHDMGNLNFSFLCHRKNYDLDRQMKMVVSSLSALGISAVINERKDILVDGRKVSGNAYYIRGNRNVHHGTLLVDANLEKLEKVLEATNIEFDTKSVKSKIAKVVNLVEMSPKLTVSQVMESMHQCFIETYDAVPNIYRFDDLVDEMELIQKVEKYKSWEWVFGETPRFSVELDVPSNNVPVNVSLHIQNGCIASMDVKNDTLGTLEAVSEQLYQKRFNRSILTETITGNSNLNPRIQAVFHSWISKLWM